MQLATKIRPLEKIIGLEAAIEAVAYGGFKLLDYTPNPIEEMEQAMKLFQKYGLTVHQTHAPDNRYNGKSEEQLIREVEECIRFSAEMGAKYIAFHGNVFDYERETYTPEAALLHNYNFFAPAVELAEKCNIKLAFENTFADYLECTQNKPHFCARAEDLAALIDKFQSDHVCACWDTGHAAIAYHREYRDHQAEGIEILGKRIECTHVHDNNLRDDMHLMPLLASIDWDACMHALHAYGNVEVLCFEPVYEKIPAIAAKEYAAFHYKIGLDLISRMK